MWLFDNPSCDDDDGAPTIATGDDDGDDDNGDECDPRWVGEFQCHQALITFAACEDDDHDDDSPVTMTDDDEDDCEDSNSATLCVYSLNMPVQGTGHVSIDVECGEHDDEDDEIVLTGDGEWDDDDDCGRCTGVITGMIPGCNGCPSPVEPSTWGTIKNAFRK
jgi:hypothetical protein